jgi:diguanylate cyclase (GGDEF)-like protein
MTRAFFLVLALLVLHLLLGALCLLIARGEHKSPALRWWGWGLTVYAAGLLATLSGALGMPRAVASVTGNTFIALSSLVCATGVLTHTPFRLSARWMAPVVVAALLALVASNATGSHTMMVNVSAPTVVAGLAFFIATAAIMRQGPRDARSAARLLGGVMLAAVATWIARIVVLAMVPPGPTAAERFDLVVSSFAIAQMVIGVAATLALIWIDVRLMQAELSRVAHTDALTGLPNRRAARSRFGEEMARASRAGRKFAMALFDIDHFKQVNDRHGHAVGDRVLRAVAEAVGAGKRGEEMLARIGGEEFLVLVSQETVEGARDAAERLRRAAGAAVVAASGGDVRVTLSGGVALYPEDGNDWERLFAAADRRLYAAKRDGRDRLECRG